MSAVFVHALKGEIASLQAMLQQLNDVLNVYQDKRGAQDGAASPAQPTVARTNTPIRTSDREETKRMSASATPSRPHVDHETQPRGADGAVRSSP